MMKRVAGGVVLAVVSVCVVLSSSSVPLRARGQDVPLTPGPFNKVAPGNGATRTPLSFTASWTASSPALLASPAARTAMQSKAGPRRILRASGRTTSSRVGIGDAQLLQDAPQTATMVVTYGAGFPAPAQAAFEAAANVWEALLTSAVSIKVDATWTALGAGVLGSGGPAEIFKDFPGAPRAGIWYPSALADKLRGQDLSASSPDIEAAFNSTSINWYFGTDGNAPPGTFDFFTVVLHELGHGLGFLASPFVDGGLGFRGFGNDPFFPIVFDLFIENGAGENMNTAAFPDGSTALASFLQSSNLWFDSPRTLTANGGLRARLYAPTVFEEGASISHLDELDFPTGHASSLMTPFLDEGEAVHSPGPVTVAMLQDSDWDPEAFTYEFCLDTTNNNFCDGAWFDVGAATTHVVTFLQPGTTYFWQVRARSSLGGSPVQADGGTWWSFTTADPAAVSDFDGNGTADLAVFRNGNWFIRNQSTVAFGLPGDVPVPGDYDGDGDVDTAVYRPSSGEWFVPGNAAVQFGGPGDIPVPGDYNGDGITDIAVFHPSQGPLGVFHVRDLFEVELGLKGDVPVVGDWDRDGLADPGVYRRSTGTWHILRSTSGLTTQITRQWGLVGDEPVNGDYDGDLQDDFAVYRNGNWFLLLSGGNYATSEMQALGVAGDRPIGTMDIDADGRDELVVFRPYDGTWSALSRLHGIILDTARGVSPDGPSVVQHGLAGDVPVTQRPRIPSTRNSDFDGDSRSDFTVFRPSDGFWFTRLSSTNYEQTRTEQWGVNGDVRVPGDYDGDGRTDVAVYRPSNGFWFLKFSSTGFTTSRAEQWGLSGDLPVPADFDGDGKTDLAVYRDSTGQWFVRLSSTDYATFVAASWGLPGDVPVVGDYDGDGKAEFAVFRPSNSTWFLRLTGAGASPTIAKAFGVSGDFPVPADFDGDGRTDLAVFRPSSGSWFATDALLPGTLFTVQWGLGGDIPVPHDYDGDGGADPTVFRPFSGDWFVRRSSNGTMLQVQWGMTGDSPLSRRRSGSDDDR